MEPRDYSTIRSILKKEQVQSEKIAPYIFKIANTKNIYQKLNTSLGDKIDFYHKNNLQNDLKFKACKRKKPKTY